MIDEPCPRTLARFKPGVIFATVMHCFTKFEEQRRCELCGMIQSPKVGLPPQESHRINSSRNVAVASDYTWLPIETCPHNMKVQLLGRGGVANYGIYHGDPFYTDWAPLPRRRDV